MKAGWDTRVLFVEQKQRWWWNAYLEVLETELYGFADSREEAQQAMSRAIQEVEEEPVVPYLRRRDDC